MRLIPDLALEYKYLHIDDENLTKAELKEKRKEKAFEEIRKKRKKRQGSKAQRDEEKRKKEELIKSNPAKFVAELRTQKLELEKKLDELRKLSFTSTRRRNKHQNERMRLVNLQANIDSDDSAFGMNDDDWNIYVKMNKSPTDAIPKLEKQLEEIYTLLERYDDSFSVSPEEINQLHLGIERIRIPEALFQPSILGMDCMGLCELVCQALHAFPNKQLELAKNILISGGGAQFCGIAERIEREVRSHLPVGCDINVTIADEPSLSAWNGARLFANSDGFFDTITTKAQYDEYGPAYIKEHHLSNLYFATPT